jgi:hypothetical protein
MRKAIRSIGLVALAISIGIGVRVAYSFVRFSIVENRISQIKAGQPRTFVVSKLGMPNYHAGACGEIGRSDKNCALEYDYSHPLAPFIPEYQVIQFSADDQVIAVEEWDSP